MICKSCSSKLDKNALKFGLNPKTSDFLKYSNHKNISYDLSVSNCSYCNLIQLVKPINYKMITPKLKWIVNKEEDGHHSKIANILIKRNIVKKNSKIMGLSHYDKRIIEELNRKKYKKTKIISLKKDFNEKYDSCRQEVIQNFLDKSRAEVFVKKYGKYDILLCSKILEHTHNLKKFFKFVKIVLNVDGFIIVDVPDCEKSLIQGNVTMIWEEHVFYFIKKTLINTFNLNGFRKENIYIFPYKQENALVGIFNLKGNNKLIYNKDKIFQIYKKKIKKYKKLIHNKLKKLGNAAMYGAGHNSIIFINLFNLSKYIKFIVDNNPKKLFMFTPKSLVKILPSSYLNNYIKLCLLSVSPSLESKIIKKHSSFIKNKGKFYSIYPDSRRFILNKK